MYTFDRKPPSPTAQPPVRQTTPARSAKEPVKPRYVWMFGTQTIGAGAPRSSPALKTTVEEGQSPDDAPVASPLPVQPGPAGEALPAPGDSGAEPMSSTKVGGTLTVTWKPHPSFGRNNAQLRLNFVAKFLFDATHEPAYAEFAQNAADAWSFSDGPRKGEAGTTKMHDDGYSRRDDKTHSYGDVHFVSSDSPGFKNSAELAADDVLDYSFTAEQLIKDNRTGAEVIKIPAHTETVKGKHPRTSSLTKPVTFTKSA